jgi:hypothetical protein
MDKNKTEYSFVIARVVINVIMIMFILLTPWWVYSSALLFFIFYFKLYYEAIFLGLFIDALYGPSVILDFPLFFTFSVVILFFGSEFIKKNLYK